jgi:hypothetical protein
MSLGKCAWRMAKIQLAQMIAQAEGNRKGFWTAFVNGLKSLKNQIPEGFCGEPADGTIYGQISRRLADNPWVLQCSATVFNHQTSIKAERFSLLQFLEHPGRVIPYGGHFSRSVFNRGVYPFQAVIYGDFRRLTYRTLDKYKTGLTGTAGINGIQIFVSDR